MEQLTRLQTSRRAYRSHVTRILNKVEDTLAKEIDELALTYLKTAVTQLEKKHAQICKADTEIAELIQEPEELEAAILDSEELQDLITENINELNKRVEILSRQPSCITSMLPQDSDENSETSSDLESQQENVSSQQENVCITVSSTSQTTSTHDTSMHGTIVTSIANEFSVTSVNEQSATSVNELPVVCASSVTPINTVSESISTFPMSELTSLCSISVSSVLYPSVSYVHSFWVASTNLKN